MKNLTLAKFILAISLCPGIAYAQSLKGSSTSVENQYRAALAYGYTFVKTARAVQKSVKPSQLIRVYPDQHMELHNVSYPYAVAGTKLFLSRLSSQYKSACGEKLTVTSLLRPKDAQPANSVARSVHPTGMAVDLRIPRSHKCRSWLEKTLLSLEKERVVDVTRERRPPHYHVAVFAKDYETRVAALTGSDVTTSQGAFGYQYVIRRGDTLSGISSRTGISVAQLRAANGLRGTLIKPGQKIQIPARRTMANAGMSKKTPATNATTHRVTRGDTLWGIANRYGTSVEHLRLVNSQSDDSLQVGQVLRIYNG